MSKDSENIENAPATNGTELSDDEFYVEKVLDHSWTRDVSC